MNDFLRIILMLLMVGLFVLANYFLWAWLGYMGMTILGIVLGVVIILLAMKYIRPRS